VVTEHHSEVDLAFIAQKIDFLTPKLQQQLLQLTTSYQQLFNGEIDDCSPFESEQITQIRKAYHNAQWESTLDQLHEQVQLADATIIPITSDDYPMQLKQISSPPPLLFVKGDLGNLRLPQIAIVGSRQMTRGGERNAEDFARFLANSGFAITSGLAVGIDGAAHRGALQAHSGATIAVMATGINAIYPRQHNSLSGQILDSGGTLVTEFFPNTKPLPHHFPQRNRVISGLSIGVLVIEAAMKSGSLITARTALEQNREVFAIPGSIHNPQSRGCHWLIKQGASLVQEAEDIITELAGALAGLNESISQPLSVRVEQDFDNNEQALLDLMGFEPVELETLIERSQWSVTKLLQMLISLELRNAIANENGCYQRLG
jgi:DNA processing protein